VPLELNYPVLTHNDSFVSKDNVENESINAVYHKKDSSPINITDEHEIQM
jgi:hypothetical protein